MKENEVTWGSCLGLVSCLFAALALLILLWELSYMVATKFVKVYYLYYMEATEFTAIMARLPVGQPTWPVKNDSLVFNVESSAGL